MVSIHQTSINVILPFGLIIFFFFFKVHCMMDFLKKILLHQKTDVASVMCVINGLTAMSPWLRNTTSIHFATKNLMFRCFYCR